MRTAWGPPAVVLLALPMVDLTQNALMVNALQRGSSIVVQNSVREGFGLTVDGRLVDDPEDPLEICEVLGAMLRASDERDVWGRSAQRRAHQHFLVFAQIEAWLPLLEAGAAA